MKCDIASSELGTELRSRGTKGGGPVLRGAGALKARTADSVLLRTSKFKFKFKVLTGTAVLMFDNVRVFVRLQYVGICVCIIYLCACMCLANVKGSWAPSAKKKYIVRNYYKKEKKERMYLLVTVGIYKIRLAASRLLPNRR